MGSGQDPQCNTRFTDEYSFTYFRFAGLPIRLLSLGPYELGIGLFLLSEKPLHPRKLVIQWSLDDITEELYRRLKF